MINTPKEAEFSSVQNCQMYSHPKGNYSPKIFSIASYLEKLINCGFRTKDILILTNSRKSIAEIQLNRTENNLSNDYISYHTFHSFALLILSDFGFLVNYRTFNIIDEKEKFKILKDIFSKNKIDLYIDVLFDLNVFKTTNKCMDECLRPLFEDYNNFLREKRLIDFSDLIDLSLQIIKRNPEVAAHYQRMFRYAVVEVADEGLFFNSNIDDLLYLLFGKSKMMTTIREDGSDLCCKNNCCVGSIDHDCLTSRTIQPSAMPNKLTFVLSDFLYLSPQIKNYKYIKNTNINSRQTKQQQKVEQQKKQIKPYSQQFNQIIEHQNSEYQNNDHQFVEHQNNELSDDLSSSGDNGIYFSRMPQKCRNTKTKHFFRNSYYGQSHTHSLMHFPKDAKYERKCMSDG